MPNSRGNLHDNVTPRTPITSTTTPTAPSEPAPAPVERPTTTVTPTPDGGWLTIQASGHTTPAGGDPR